MCVSGFGELSNDIVYERMHGQSYTCSEKRASLNVVNDLARPVVFVRLDGGYFPNGGSCDFSISLQMQPPVGFLLELKGRDMDHAIEQLRCALKKLKQTEVSVRYQKAYVVSSGASKIPSAGWSIRQRRFLNETGVRLGRYQNNTSVDFSEAVA